MYLADLHVHSRYSRATSKSLSIRKLAAWASIKGLSVIATGDFTHPGWMEEIEKYLIQEDNGLLRLKDSNELNRELEIQIDYPIIANVHFILCTEISSIYKKNGKVRKVHNLVFMPNIEKAKEFNNKLENIGNLASDGRPILGLDSEHLLEMVLETDPKAFLVPAHIWTPWFSLFGSRSGFDSIEECFGSLSSEIFALETGLSSDPPMNWLWSSLDRFYLISNSDAHSGEKLGREANLFSGEISYLSIYNSLKYKTGEFKGTIEFFPEEGKYHLDGHRKCNIVLDPIEAMKLNNICPVCGKPLTIGVMHRILSLSDRKRPERPDKAPGFYSLIPLTEILSEIMGKGPKTKGVYKVYASLIKRFQSEIEILMRVDIEELKKASPMLAESIKRMRQGKVHKEPGFDGQYGRISIFKPKEKPKTHEINTDQSKLFIISPPLKNKDKKHEVFNKKQLIAIKTKKTPVLVIAGPGTGKTKTLIGRATYLMDETDIDPQKILILTFTQAAAFELKARMGSTTRPTNPVISTLHGLGYEILKEQKGSIPIILDDSRAKSLFLDNDKNHTLWSRYLYERERMLEITSIELHKRYVDQKQKLGVYDYTDLLEFLISYLKDQNNTPCFEHVLVDEIQDLSPIQMEILKLLCKNRGKGLFGIGDPNQAIYSFRGGVQNIVEELKSIYPQLEILSLEENYRSTQEIINFSSPLIEIGPSTKAVTQEKGNIVIYEAAQAQMEANWIAKQIKGLIGSTSHMEVDQGLEGRLSPSEIAILVRFKGLIGPIKKTLNKYGIPCSMPNEINFYEDPQVEHFLEIIAQYIQGMSTPIKDIDIYDLDAVQNKLIEINIFDPMFFRSENFLKLKSKLRELKNWREVLNSVALQKKYDNISQMAQKVSISTIHASKGLEFEAVFLPALEDNIIPFKRDVFLNEPIGVFEEDDIGEEKRLLFVGMTRARSMLFLSYSKKRSIYGKKFSFPPSPFLKTLPLKQATRIKAKLKKKKKIHGLSF